MNRTLKNGVVLVSLVALAGGGAWFVKSRSDATAAAALATTPSAFTWQRGSRYRYDFDWAVTSSSAVDLTGGSGDGATDASSHAALRGQLVFTCYGSQGDGWLFGVSVEALDEAKLDAMGNDLLGAPGAVSATFDDRQAFLELGSRGEVRHLRFRAADPPLFKQLLQSVMAESQVVLAGKPAAREWQSTETFSVGKLEMHYAVEASDPLFVHRTPTRLLAATALPRGMGQGIAPVLRGGSDVHLDHDGFVRSVATKLDVTIGPLLEHHTSFSMTFVSIGQARVPETFVIGDVAPEVLEPGQPPAAPELRQRMDERFSARTSQASLERMLDAYAKGLPPARGMLDANAAFLRLHPEACDGVASRFLDPEVNDRTREFMMGLLASAGSPAAQTAMRRALDMPESRGDLGIYGRMIQRLGFVASPTPESLAYALSLYGSPAIVGDADLKRVTGLTLGALAAHASGPAAALGESIHARLVTEMKTAMTADQRAGLVAAVGNAARPSDVPALRAIAKDDNARVRESVARALRGVDSPDTRAALREMMTDPSAEVARAAMSSYDQRTLAASDMTELATLSSGGLIVPGADASLVSVVQGHMDENNEASQQILESVLARHPEGKGAGQIRLLLRRLRGET